MIYTVDRIEGEFAILEDEEGGLIHQLLTDLPAGTAEGDKLEPTRRGWRLRPDLRAVTLEQNRRLLERLRKRDPN